MVLVTVITIVKFLCTGLRLDSVHNNKYQTRLKKVSEKHSSLFCADNQLRRNEF
jgi:hypothetical protein